MKTSIEQNLNYINQILYRIFMKVKSRDLYRRIHLMFSGGFKTWECSYDLVDYLKTIIENFQNTTTVIEVRK